MTEPCLPSWEVTYKRHAADTEETIVVTGPDEIAALKMARKLLDLALHPDDRHVRLGYGLPVERRTYRMMAVRQLEPGHTRVPAFPEISIESDSSAIT